MLTRFSRQPDLQAQIANLLWLIWKARNEFVFQNKIDTNNIWSLSKSMIIHNKLKATRKANIKLQWKPPPPNWFKLNIDGASKNNPGRAGIGGIIRDSSGSFIMAYARNIGVFSNNKAECWAAKEGVNYARDLDIKKLVIETDSSVLISNLRRKDMQHKEIHSLLVELWKTLTSFEVMTIEFGYREVNAVADNLAKLGSTMVNNGVLVFDKCPDFFIDVLENDVKCTFERLCDGPCTNSVVLMP